MVPVPDTSVNPGMMSEPVNESIAFGRSASSSELEVRADRERQPSADVEREEHAPAPVGRRHDHGCQPGVLLDRPAVVAVREDDRRHALQHVDGMGMRGRRLGVPAEEHVHGPLPALAVLVGNERADEHERRAEEDRPAVGLRVVVGGVAEHVAAPLVVGPEQVGDQQPVVGDQVRRLEERDRGRVLETQTRRARPRRAGSRSGSTQSSGLSTSMAAASSTSETSTTIAWRELDEQLQAVRLAGLGAGVSLGVERLQEVGGILRGRRCAGRGGQARLPEQLVARLRVVKRGGHLVAEVGHELDQLREDVVRHRRQAPGPTLAGTGTGSGSKVVAWTM